MDTPQAGQQWSAVDYANNGRFVADLGVSLLSWLAPHAGERILDLGCGDGALTEQIVRAGASVVGADASPELVAAARARGVDARIVDGQNLSFEAEFDAVFSNAALHWMKRDPDAVLRGVARALRPGGRFVGEMGGAGNIAVIRGALHDALAARGIDAARLDPWFFPTVADYRLRLQQAGFTVTAIESYGRPTPLPGDIGGWLETFAQAFLGGLDAPLRASVIDELRSRLRTSLAASGPWVADYVRLRFIAIKPLPL